MGYILRQIEDVYKKILFARQDPDDRLYYFSQGDFPGLLSRDHSFKNKYGSNLNGRFYYYANCREDKLVVFDHGLAPWHKSYMREIEMLCRHGYPVFTFDHTGCGDSEGENIMGLCGSLSDLDDCINELNGIDSLKSMEICVVGHSRGGYSTLNIYTFHPEISKIVAMSAFVSLKTMQKQVTPFLLAPFRNRIFDLEKKTNPDYVNCSAVDSLSSCNNPALIIHSNDDKTVSCKANFNLLRRRFSNRENTQFLLLCGVDHYPTFTKSAVKLKRELFMELSKIKKEKKKNPDFIEPYIIDKYDWYKITEQNKDVWNKIFEFLDK